MNLSTPHLVFIIKLLWAATTITSLTPTFAFSPSQLTTTSTSVTTSVTTSTSTSTTLFAKKPKKNTKSKRNNSTSGSGFGSSTTTSKSSPTQSTRSVSGYTGSGTKPLRIAANTFDAIRQKYGKEACTDVYVKSPLNDPLICWFVGKVARRIQTDVNGEDISTDPKYTGSTIPTEMDAVISQKRLILEYAKNQLRPQNLGGPYAKDLELFIAPGDSEMDSVQNKVTFTKVVGSISTLSEGFSVGDVGYNPEIYVGDEIKEGGLRVKRDDDGKPVKPVFEIQ